MNRESDPATPADDRERMLALADLVSKTFPQPVAFMVIVHDFHNAPAPMSVDNFDSADDALAMLKLVAGEFAQARAATFHRQRDAWNPAEPRPMPKTESDDGERSS